MQQKTQQVLSQLMASPSVRALEWFFHVTRVDGHDTDTGTLARVTYGTERFKVDKVRKRKLPFHENTVCFYLKQQTDWNMLKLNTLHPLTLLPLHLSHLAVSLELSFCWLRGPGRFVGRFHGMRSCYSSKLFTRHAATRNLNFKSKLEATGLSWLANMKIIASEWQ